MAKTTPHPHKPAPPLTEDIDLKLDGGFVIASHDDVVTIYEMVWESRHTERTRRLTLRKCKVIPRQFERLVYGPAVT